MTVFTEVCLSTKLISKSKLFCYHVELKNKTADQITSLPTYPSFDCSPDGAAVRWQKWTERLENAFVAFDITNGARKKVLMLTYAGNADLNDIVDTFSEEDLTPGEGETHYKTCVE